MDQEIQKLLELDSARNFFELWVVEQMPARARSGWRGQQAQVQQLQPTSPWSVASSRRHGDFTASPQRGADEEEVLQQAHVSASSEGRTGVSKMQAVFLCLLVLSTTGTFMSLRFVWQEIRI